MLQANTGMTARELIQVHNGLCPSEQRIEEWKASKQALVDRIEALATDGGTEEIADAASGFEPGDREARPSAKDLILRIARDPHLTCEEVAGAVRAETGGNTSARSVASVICVANRAGAGVPKRARGKRTSG